MKKYLANAFSLNMLSGDATIVVKEVTLDDAKVFIQSAESSIGHQGTSEYISLLTGITVSTNRVALKLQQGDQVLVLQLLGRLPEGVTLSKDEVAQIPHKWFLVTVV